eukprot:CAMPEP_0171144946 /NCGR_PEP_ID=MMETSP0766_2-20121228/146796_1 /TAXON_ID=439317 /ORGANISM="Gambierdiscus australes, Strain CAWD 149" /LENGTH=53 /DNA_ID=CAMNT_0011608827 /DNA_START=11 /DNA_END=168 /DNA_ORIENTATION=-
MPSEDNGKNEHAGCTTPLKRRRQHDPHLAELMPAGKHCSCNARRKGTCKEILT